MDCFWGGNHNAQEVQRKLTEEERQMLISVFHSADEHHNGQLRREDIKVAMVQLFGYKPSKEDFLVIMAPKLKATDEDEEIRQIFLAFDSKCRGFIGLDDLQKAFSLVAPHMAAHSIASAFREIDRDGDGRVSFKDFEFMMKYSKENGF